MKLTDILSKGFNPAEWEQKGYHYPVRREPTAFTLCLKGGTAAQADTLSKIGFKVTINQ